MGYSERIWLLYPPAKENLSVFAQSSGESGRLSKISGKLVEGCIARVDSSRVVYLPPGWLHATFTTKPGALVGINFESLEGLEIMARSVAIHLPYLYRVLQAVLEDFGEYAKAILFFFDDEHDPQIITTVLKSWVVFSKVLSGFQSAVLAFLDGLKKGLSQKEAWCCGTTKMSSAMLLTHTRWLECN